MIGRIDKKSGCLFIGVSDGDIDRMRAGDVAHILFREHPEGLFVRQVDIGRIDHPADKSRQNEAKITPPDSPPHAN